MELELDALDDNNQFFFLPFPEGWLKNGSNTLNYPCMFQQPTNSPYNQPQSPEQLLFPHFSTPSNHIPKIQKPHLCDSPRSEYDFSSQQYQFHLNQDISPFDPTEFKSPSPQKNPPNSANNKSNLLNCSFKERNVFSKALEEQNPTLPGENDTGEPSFRNEIDELWKDESRDSFGKPQNILDLGSSLSLNNEDEIEIQGAHDSLILNDLSSILDPLEKDPIVEENMSTISEEFEGEIIEKKVRLKHTDYNKRRIEEPLEIKKNKWEKLPGKILQGIKKGCQYYYTRTKGIKIDCVTRVLDNKPIEAQKKFENFIANYKPPGKTWEYITSYIRDDSEIAYMMTELAYELLSSKDDLEVWMTNSKMSRKTKDYIRVKKDNLKDKFIYHLYPKG